ncbi:MAG: aldose 1-epimerase [Clostridia bacterium]|nr:aldose 1-epimerase [Clostridia bacterium]
MYEVWKEQLEGFGYEQIVMKNEHQEIRILPEAGFNVWYWHYEGQEILMKPVDITVIGTKYGIPILFPTPNRMRNGEYLWKGKTYQMTKRGARVNIHGLVKDEPFTVTRLEGGETAVCEAKISIAKGDDLYEGYPFPCTLSVTYELSDAGLHMDMRVVNEGTEEMPFGFAVHPYFSKRGDATQVFMNAPVKRAYVADAGLLPSGEIRELEEEKRADRGWHSIDSLYLDTVFRGMTEDLESEVRWKDLSVYVGASDCYRNIVIYTPHDRPGFCIEPQTCSTDAINLYAKGYLDESGLLILQPGAEFRSWVNYRVEKHEKTACDTVPSI